MPLKERKIRKYCVIRPWAVFNKRFPYTNEYKGKNLQSETALFLSKTIVHVLFTTK